MIPSRLWSCPLWWTCKRCSVNSLRHVRCDFQGVSNWEPKKIWNISIYRKIMVNNAFGCVGGSILSNSRFVVDRSPKSLLGDSDSFFRNASDMSSFKVNNENEQEIVSGKWRVLKYLRFHLQAPVIGVFRRVYERQSGEGDLPSSMPWFVDRFVHLRFTACLPRSQEENMFLGMSIGFFDPRRIPLEGTTFARRSTTATTTRCTSCVQIQEMLEDGLCFANDCWYCLILLVQVAVLTKNEQFSRWIEEWRRLMATAWGVPNHDGKTAYSVGKRMCFFPMKLENRSESH